VREKVSFDETSCSGILSDINAIDGIRESVLLSTCNRTEIYAVIDESPEDVRNRLEDYILDSSGANRNVLDCFVSLEGEDVIDHLFRVASGLDSMILGEPQILGQVKNAYAKACDLQCTGPELNRLFHNAFKVGKLIRNKTAVGEGAVSVSFAAVERAKEIFGTLEGRTVLLVGAGKTGELSAKRLVDIGVTHLIIANRTAGRARELAKNLGGEAAPFDCIVDLSRKVDIIISSITSAEPVITRQMLEPAVSGRNGKQLLLIDLGVPRNIDADTAELDTVQLLNIDDLEEITLGNMDKRRVEAEKAEEIIAEEVDDFSTWLSGRDAIPLIRNLHVMCEDIRLDELTKIKNRVSDEELETIDLVTRRIVRKILHNPVIRMRESESGDQRERLLKSVRELFMKDED